MMLYDKNKFLSYQIPSAYKWAEFKMSAMKSTSYVQMH